VGGYVHGEGKAVGRGVDDAAVQVVALGEGHGVDREVELAEGGVDGGEGRVDGLGLGDIQQMDMLDAEAVHYRLDEGAGLLVLVGQDQLGAGVDAGLGNAGGNGFLVGDAGDQADLALKVDDGGHVKLREVTEGIFFRNAASGVARLNGHNCEIFSTWTQGFYGIFFATVMRCNKMESYIV